MIWKSGAKISLFFFFLLLLLLLFFLELKLLGIALDRHKKDTRHKQPCKEVHIT